MDMKRIEMIWGGIILAFFLLLVVTGCQKEDSPEDGRVSTVIPDPGPAAVYFGNIRFVTTANNEIVISADICDAFQAIDGVSELNFILQRREGEQGGLNTSIQNAWIVKDQRSLRIIPVNGSDELWFVIDPVTAPDEAVTIYHGFGLSVNNGRWNNDLAFIEGYASVFDALCSNNFQLKGEVGGGGSTSDCDSGGPGSTSCSNSVGGGGFGITGSCSCSVTCGQGTYACCCNCMKCLCALNSVTKPCSGSSIN